MSGHGVLCVLSTAIAGHLGAQISSTPQRNQSIAPAYRVATTTEAISIDGHLDEAVWQHADSIVDFRQREPLEGAPATERTVVKIVRDARQMYVAVRAYDSQMSKVRSAQLRRDADLRSDDRVTLLIDSYRDRRGAFMFATNPNGAMWDAQIVGLDNVNDNWNGIWSVATSRDSISWSAEFAIPLHTLRFNPASDVIGLNVRRTILRKNEEDLWRSWGRTQGLTNLANTADVSGFENVGTARPLELYPYVLGRVITPSYDSSGARLGSSQSGGKAGIDAKLALTPTMTADLTVSTDFAQVEADLQVINLTRFPTFFPEKREFFLESSGIFDIGTSRRTQLFYSRRIGLDSTGAPVPILAGARMYGKAGPWGLGFLDARTGGNEQANDVVVRVGRDILDRSSIVAMAADRWLPGMRDERGAGVDLDFPLIASGYNLEPHFWLMGTQTAARRGTPTAWRISTDAPNDLVDAFVSLYSIDSGFNPTLGFVRRTGIWEATGHIDFQPRPGFWSIRRLDLTPIPSWDIITDRTDNLTDVSRWQTADFEWHTFAGELQSGDGFEINVHRTLDAPQEAFEIFRGTTIAPGRYWWTTGDIQLTTSTGRAISGEAIVSTGQFYDGHATSAELGATFRGGGHVIAATTYSVTSARLSSGRFNAIESTGRLEYTFNTRSGFLGFVQFNNELQRADFNLRFHWIPQVGDDVYAVWNSGYTTDPMVPRRFPSRQVLERPLNGAFIVKVVHRFSQ
ncbi:MAG TPA: DUF5916 domain-containing protein [Gemmatimonadaceae bacterium]|nr:DUF5916 domain-containing protein [Gemmatimonadaceae bacterium]